MEQSLEKGNKAKSVRIRSSGVAFPEQAGLLKDPIFAKRLKYGTPKFFYSRDIRDKDGLNHRKNLTAPDRNV